MTRRVDWILDYPHSWSDIPVQLGIIDRGLSLLDKGTRLQAARLLRCRRVALQLDQTAVQTHHHHQRVFRIGLGIGWAGMKV
jgi:hypothetical protein